MKTQEELMIIVANNITTYRKKLGLTQLQLAELISYSDKAVSKWERAEALPDVFVLSQIAEVFKITVNDLLTKVDDKKLEKIENNIIEEKRFTNRNRIIITILSALLVWFISTIIFVLLQVIPNSFPSWLTFIYAIPASAIVLLVFAKIWGERWMRFFIVSLLTWGIAISIQISLTVLINEPNAHLFYFIALAFQILTVFWYMARRRNNNGHTKKSFIN